MFDPEIATEEQREQYLAELDSKGVDPAPPPRISTAREARHEAYQESKLDRRRFRGVTYYYARRAYRAQLSVANTNYLVLETSDKEEAARAYDNAAWFLQDYRRDFPRLNFERPAHPLPKVLEIRAKLQEIRGAPNFDHNTCFEPPFLPDTRLAEPDNQNAEPTERSLHVLAYAQLPKVKEWLDQTPSDVWQGRAETLAKQFGVDAAVILYALHFVGVDDYCIEFTVPAV